MSALIKVHIRFILFKRLNTGGLELTPQEIRNAVYQGYAADTIKNLANLPEFIKATNGRIPKKRMQDRDFVSRFVAFYLINYSNYQPSIDDFINSSMELLEKTKAESIERDFKESLDLAYEIFERDAFRKRTNPEERQRPINKAYFEVITVTFAKLPDENKKKLLIQRELFKDNLMTLMTNDRYSNSLSGGTGTKDSVNIRFSWFEQVLIKSINGIKIRINNDNKIEDIQF